MRRTAYFTGAWILIILMGTVRCKAAPDSDDVIPNQIVYSVNFGANVALKDFYKTDLISAFTKSGLGLASSMRVTILPELGPKDLGAFRGLVTSSEIGIYFVITKAERLSDGAMIDVSLAKNPPNSDNWVHIFKGPVTVDSIRGLMKLLGVHINRFLRDPRPLKRTEIYICIDTAHERQVRAGGYKIFSDALLLYTSIAPYFYTICSSGGHGDVTGHRITVLQRIDTPGEITGNSVKVGLRNIQDDQFIESTETSISVKLPSKNPGSAVEKELVQFWDTLKKYMIANKMIPDNLLKELGQ